MTDLSRREMVAAMAAAAGAFMIPKPAEAARVAAIVARQRRAGYAPKVYTPHEWATVSLLVDLIIPKDSVSGAATDAAVPEFMDTMLDLEPGMRTAHRGGLAWLDDESHRRHQHDFVDLGDAERREILDAIAFPKRARPEMARAAAWFSSFRAFTATGFFTSEIGVADLGYQGNTVVPEWTGCPAENYTRLGVSKPA